jgi:hypothetical protein
MPIEPHQNKKIHHISHVSNLMSIIQTGGLYSGYELRIRGFNPTNIGHTSLKEKRARWPVPVAPGGTLERYVPFFFTTRPPMIVSISKGHVVDYGGTQREIVYLVSSIEAIVNCGSPWCFTDGHAVESVTKYYTDLEHLTEIDWIAIGAWDYRQPDTMRKKQAEFLVFKQVPWECIELIAVKDREMLEYVKVILEKSKSPHRPNINIERNWYHNPRSVRND